MDNFLNMGSVSLYPTVPTGSEADVVVGIREALINNAINDLFKGLYPTYFKGHVNLPKVNLSLMWNINKAPILTFTSHAGTQKDFDDYCMTSYNNETDGRMMGNTMLPNDFISEMFSGYQPALLELQIPSVEFKAFKTDDRQQDKVEKLKIRFSCYINSSEEGVLTITPFSGRVENASVITDMVKELTVPADDIAEVPFSLDEITLLIINELLLPFVMKTCENVIPQIKIPTLEVEGIRLEKTTISFEDHCILARTYVSQASMEQDMAVLGTAWPSDNFFVQLNDHAIKTVTTGLMPLILKKMQSIKISGSKWGISYDVDLSLDAKEPLITLDSSDISLSFEKLKGVVPARVHWWLVRFGLQLELESNKPANINVFPKLEGDKVCLKFRNSSNFSFDVRLYSENIKVNFILEVLAIVINAIAPNAIKNAIFWVIEKFSFSLPKFKVKAFDNALEISLEKTNVEIKDKKVTAVGDMKFNVSNKINDRIVSKAELKPGDLLVSANGLYTLEFQKEGGYIVIKRLLDNTIVWKSDNESRTPSKLVMCENGSLAAYDSKGIYWQTGEIQGHKSGCYAVLELDGTLVLYDREDIPYWHSNITSKLMTLEKLFPGDMLESKNGKFRLIFDRDGLLSIYQTSDNKRVWTNNERPSNQQPECLWFQADGNLVAYARAIGAYWATKKHDSNPSYATIQDDGILALYKKEGDSYIPYWKHTNTEV